MTSRHFKTARHTLDTSCSKFDCSEKRKVLGFLTNLPIKIFAKLPIKYVTQSYKWLLFFTKGLRETHLQVKCMNNE